MSRHNARRCLKTWMASDSCCMTGGCGGTREDSNNLCGLIAGYLHHPNVAGATVLSLGCQHAQIPILREEIRKRNPPV